MTFVIRSPVCRNLTVWVDLVRPTFSQESTGRNVDRITDLGDKSGRIVFVPVYTSAWGVPEELCLQASKQNVPFRYEIARRKAVI
jgi:hypothetical protein